MRNRLITAVVSLFMVAGLTACANTDTETTHTPDDGQMASSGMTLGAQIPADSEVDQIRFRVTPVNCSTGAQMGSVMTQTKDLQDMMLPGGISKFEGAPFDADSQHAFADAFFLVDATGQNGPCYNVRTRPLNNGSPAQGCEPATRNRVAVEDGQTTEILLVNQCRGAARGGLDVISAINRAPAIENLTLDKFLASCPTDTQANEICVTASDPDNDPLEIVWSATDAGQFTGDIVETVQEHQLANGNWRSCAQVSLNRVGDYQFRVDVYDTDGNGNRMEDVLDSRGNSAASSSDDLTFPVYSGVQCQARTATIMMAIGDYNGNRAIRGGDVVWAKRTIRQLARWTSPVDEEDTEVLYVLDDNNNGEHLPQDRKNIFRELNSLFDFNPQWGLQSGDAIMEPQGGLDSDDIAGYDLVWFANPGWPTDDLQSLRTLRQANQNGVGVILEGNDISRGTYGEPSAHRYFTGMDFLNNGTETCGVTTNNYSPGHYRVTFSDEPFSPFNGMLGGQTLDYHDDIDHANALSSFPGGGTVLEVASWSFPAEQCDPGERRTGPVITVRDP